MICEFARANYVNVNNIHITQRGRSPAFGHLAGGRPAQKRERMDAHATRAMTSNSISEGSRWSGVRDWFRRAEATLDDYGPAAWIGAMILGFIVFVPLGLVLLGYMIWSGRMGCRGRGRRSAFRGRSFAAGSTGNRAFDDYRDETLKRLEEEREAFNDFMTRLRKAKDQAEFDQFMTERRNNAGQPGDQTGGFGGVGA